MRFVAQLQCLWPAKTTRALASQGDNHQMEPTAGMIAKALGKEAGEVVRKEAESFLSTVLNEPARALSGLLADKINARRQRNLIPMVLEANKRLKEAGLQPKAVPLKIIHPLLESASLEEEPDLRELWANLLSNAADSREINPVHPIFISILNNLTSSEAKFLNALYDARNVRGRVKMVQPGVDLLGVGISDQQLLDIGRECGVIERPPSRVSQIQGEKPDRGQYFQDCAKALHRIIDILRRNGIIKETTVLLPVRIRQSQVERGPYNDADTLDIETEQEYRLTELGVDFVRACRAPSTVIQGED
jgi:hypothetical protein